ncbi:hypothetical protein CH63R_09196 [Colletotrichum higginsianum IMI 349063]|uniref:Uncharacterized protein n=1 Tax=Colletotrichum higginsianum (strain IMI 349063) TaxID=759273 RepID=A0A1B7Y6T0_COLHI|nr:hypothetical protein CH63R_09196 [Colletotrichum higginsianum IMI 349063]OBR07675.1 hypothetical protein CH63R_09196 [Colletotrichum higginsianum IMI 349063]
MSVVSGAVRAMVVATLMADPRDRVQEHLHYIDRSQNPSGSMNWKIPTEETENSDWIQDVSTACVDLAV